MFHFRWNELWMEFLCTPFPLIFCWGASHSSQMQFPNGYFAPFCNLPCRSQDRRLNLGPQKQAHLPPFPFSHSSGYSGIPVNLCTVKLPLVRSLLLLSPYLWTFKGAQAWEFFDRVFCTKRTHLDMWRRIFFSIDPWFRWFLVLCRILSVR
jgi:hypothetical protein